MSQAIKPFLACSQILNPEDYDKLPYPVIASTKLDGIRALINADGNPQSRSGKPIPNKFIQRTLAESNLLGSDGEILASTATHPNSMQAAMTAFSTVQGEPDFTYYVFDNYLRGKTPFIDYLPILKRLNKNTPEWVKVLPQRLIYTAKELEVFAAEVVAEGYEGVIIRSTDSPYKHGRATFKQKWMLKIKPYTYEEGIIHSLNERQVNYNPKNIDELGFSKRSSHKYGKVPGDTLGSFNIKDKNGLLFSIGTGPIDAIGKQNIWNTRNGSDSWIGKLITFKHFAQSGVRKKPRHGMFVSLRSVEDL